MIYRRIIKPILFSLSIERAHAVVLLLLRIIGRIPGGRWLLRTCYAVEHPALEREVFGRKFRNPVGLAAGFDHNGEAVRELAALGFGFVEVGTVTPKGQPGNPRPRIFRLPEAKGLINRLGFNNEGLDAFVANVKKARYRQNGGILGLNIGKNAATPIENAVDDYILCLDGVYPHADYVVVNISSPNTKNLRSLQSDEALDGLLGRLQEHRQTLIQRHGRTVPMFVKIAPDLDETQVGVIAATLQKNGLDGVIATNTTLSRDAVKGLQHGEETGGLSGRPVFEASNQVIRQLRAALGPRFPIIGVGGVFSGADARAKREAGADLVQIYSGLIYEGPGLVDDCARALKA